MPPPTDVKSERARVPDSSLIRPVSAGSPDSDENAVARRFVQELTEDDLYVFWEKAVLSLSVPYFAYPPENPLVWVKFGGSDVPRIVEAEMQKLAWTWIRNERRAGRCSPGIHVPEVYKVFTRDGWTFIIMQLLKATPFDTIVRRPAEARYPQDRCYDLISEGIQLMRRVPVPHDATPGPYTRDHALRKIRHPLFKEHRAAIVYRSIDELQDHLNKVHTATTILNHNNQSVTRAVFL